MKKKISIFSVLLIVIGLIVYLKNLPCPYSIQSTNPENNANKIFDNQPLIITFSSPVPLKNQAKITLNSSPSINLKTSWQDEKTMMATPTKPLNTNTNYQITINYRLKPIFQFNFTTNLYSTTELNAQAIEQIQSDIDYVKAKNKINEEFPWLKKLPIENNDYSIVYDFELNKIRIHLKTTPPTKNIEQIILKKATNQIINDVGVDVGLENLLVILPSPSL